MYWQRILLGIAIIAMTVTMFVPLPMWVAVTLISVSLVAAVGVVIQLARSRPDG